MSRFSTYVGLDVHKKSIANATAALAHEHDAVEASLTIPIAISARHIHLTREAVEALFGPGHQLTPYKPLSQPGQFACEEKLTIVGPRRSLEGVRVLGPERSKCQVEVSRTDEFFLGIDAPVRDSGDVADSPGVTLVGPAGQLQLKEGLICARRHIHMTPEDAERTARAIPGATLALMPGIGHFPMSENPAAFRPHFIAALARMG